MSIIDEFASYLRQSRSEEGKIRLISELREIFPFSEITQVSQNGKIVKIKIQGEIRFKEVNKE